MVVRSLGGRRARWALVMVTLLLVALYLLNASWLADPLDGRTQLLAHRALGQQFSREGLDATTCTARRMLAPEHEYLENTIRSMRAAFAYGADIVELGVPFSE